MLQDSVMNATGHHSFAYLMGFWGLFPPYLAVNGSIISLSPWKLGNIYENVIKM